MEIKQIYDCQEVLDSVSKIETEEERKCDQLLRNPKTIKWLGERKSNLDKEIKEIEGKILDKGGILSKKKAKESEKEKISKILESKTNNLNNIKVAESDKNLQVKLEAGINEAEKKIKEHDLTIYEYGKSKYKIDEEIKNKETNVRYWESEVSSATSALSSAETELSTSQNRYSSNSCWEGRSPELSYSCVNRYKKKVEDKKTTKESYERNLNNAKKALNEEKDNSQVYAKGITARNYMKNAEIAKKAQYEKEKQEVEARMKGVLDQKSSLEAEIEKQKAEQIKINDELLSLEESANNFDSNALETQRGVLEQEFQDAASIRHWVFKYQTTEIPREIQHEEL